MLLDQLPEAVRADEEIEHEATTGPDEENQRRVTARYQGELAIG